MTRPINMVTNTEDTMKSEGNKKAFLQEAHARADRGEKNAVSTMILNQEATGAQEFQRSEVLPRDGTTGKDEANWKALGFILGDNVPDDDLFRYAKMPPGWEKKVADPSDPRHMALFDEKGRRRAFIFYKAAFYDRSANVYLTRRFRTGYESTVKDRRDYDAPVHAVVEDADGTVLWKSTEVFTKEMAKQARAENPDWMGSSHGDLAREAARVWLCANGYPDYESVLAYW